MLDNIIKYSIKNKLIVGALVFALIGWGLYSAKQLPIDAVPDITNNQVQVITSAPSQSAQDIERFVTFPIEIAMSNISDLEEIRSFSRFGLSVVTIVFKESVDIYWARQQITERLTQVQGQIPEGIGTPELMPITTGLGEIYQYTLSPKEGYEDKFDAMELRSIQDWIVRRQLLGIEGVAEVGGFGGKLKQYEIALDPDRLLSLNISINQLFEALSKNNQNTGGAYIDKNPKAYFIRSEGLIGSLDDIRNIVIKNTENGTPILVKDVAKVQFGNAIRYGAMTKDNEGEVVGGIVMMLKGANSSKVIKDVKERVAQVEKSLPEGVEIVPFLDRTKLVNKAIGTVSTNLIEGALIVIFVLVLLLGNLRAGLIVASVIPLAMLFAISLMNTFGVSGNLMSLGAIDFGIVVDGSVIIVEATLHHLGLKKSGTKLTQKGMDDEVYQSASKIRTSAAFGEIIILIVYLPLLALVGIEGKMFKPMAITVSFAILGAFILSLTYVPMMSALFLKKTITNKRTISDKIIDGLHRLYEPVLNFALQNKVTVLVATVLIFLFSLFTFSKMGSEFIPTLDEGDFAAQITVPAGSSVTHSVEVSNKASKILLEEFPDEIEQIVSKIGSAEVPTDPMPMEAADVMIILNDKKQWTKTKSKEELAEQMEHVLEENIVGASFGFQQPIQMRFNELMTGARQDVVLKVYGENLDKLTKYANQIGKIVPTVKGANDLYVEKMGGLKQIVIHYKREQLALYGLNIQDVNTVINTAFAGKSAGWVYEGEKRFDLVVRLNEKDRVDINDIKKLYIATPSGIQIPLSNVATVDFEIGPNQIQRDDAKRRITVAFNVRGRDVSSIVNELKTKVEKEVSFDAGYYITYGGTFKNLEEAKARLGLAVPAALLLILLLLYITFNSVKQSFLIFMAIPMSAIGGIFALWLRDMPFSISAGVGFIALFGVAVLNGIVLIAKFNQLKNEGITNIYEIVKKGTEIRLRPVIMTAAVASLGFLPMAMASSAGAEVQKPLATVVIGGLVSATLLTLLILPILYILFERKSFQKINSKIITSVVVFFFGTLFINAQQSPKILTEKQVINLALKKSIAYKKTEFEIAKSTAKINEAFELSPLEIEYQNVGIGANLKEKEWKVIQNFGSIVSHIQKKKLAKAETNLATSIRQIVKKETIKEARNLYQQWHYLFGLISLLEEQFQNTNKIKSIAKKLYEVGEIGGLENDVTILQSLGIQAQKSTIYKQFIEVENQLKSLLQIDEAIKPSSKFPKKLTILTDTIALSSSFKKLFDEGTKVAEKRIDVAKSAYFPEISAGIINRKEGNATAYNGFNVGLAIPLSFWSNKAKVKQQKIVKEEVVFENQAKKIALNNGLKSLQTQLQYLNLELNSIEATALKAEKFIKKIEIAYKAGEIDAFKYNQSFTTYFQVMQNYLLLINNYNKTVIDYQFYTEK